MASSQENATSDIPSKVKVFEKERDEVASKIQELQAKIEAETIREEVFDLSHKLEIGEKYKPIFGDVKCFIMPLEGTLYEIKGETIEPTPKAVEHFKKLKECGLKILLVANTWLKPKERLLRMLNKLGFPVEEQDLFTSSDCCKIFMERHNLTHPFLLVADEVLKDFPGMETLDPLQYDCVVLGLPSTMIDYRLITKALNLLFEGCPLLVLHPVRSEKAIGACKLTAPGLYSQALEFATDAKRFIPSKPSSGFYIEACRYAGIAPSDSVIIGDNITEDVRDTHHLCMRSILVKTGKYKPLDEIKYCGITPNLLVDNFYKAVMYLLCATGRDPDAEADRVAEEERIAKFKNEQQDFFRRLNAYAKDDCTKGNNSICPEKVGSFVW